MLWVRGGPSNWTELKIDKKVLYKVDRVLDGRNCLYFVMMPIDFATLDETILMWGFHKIFSCMMTPRN